MAGKQGSWVQISRDRIKAGWHLNNIQELIEKLHKEYSLLGPEEVGALKASMQGSFQLLNKVLPDLKQTDATVTHQGKVEFKWNP